MAACTNCQGTNADDAAVCVYCGQTLKKPGWWRRILDAFAGDQSLAHSEAGGQSLEHSEAGIKLQDQGRLEEAVAEFDEAIRINPELAAAYNNRAMACGEMGQYDKALADFSEAIRLESQDALYPNNRGGTYSEMGQFDRALQDFDEAIRLDPQLAAAYGNRALAYISLGMDAEAEEDLKRVEELREDTSELRGLIEEKKGQRPG